MKYSDYLKPNARYEKTVKEDGVIRLGGYDYESDKLSSHTAERVIVMEYDSCYVLFDQENTLICELNKDGCYESNGSDAMEKNPAKPTQADVVEEYIDLLNFRIQQLSTDLTERVPKKGYETEWERTKEKRRLLIDLYKRLDAERFQPEKEDQEKLYEIIAYALQHSLNIHVNKAGTARWIVTLMAAPDNEEKRHGIRIELDGNASNKRVVSHSFF